MFEFNKIIYKIMKDNKLGSYLFTALAFAAALIYIHGIQLNHTVSSTDALNKAIKATSVCQDDLRALRDDIKELEVEIAVLKEKRR